MLSSILAISLLSSSVLSLPYSVSNERRAPPSNSKTLQTSLCPLTNVQMNLPTNQTTLTVPASPQVVNWATVGTGVQNYTCNGSTYVSAGAVAQLFDISCVVNSPVFADITTLAYLLPIPPQTTTQKRQTFTPSSAVKEACSKAKIPSSSLNAVGNLLLSAGHFGNHYFPNINGSVVPKFDFTPSPGTANAKKNLDPNTEFQVVKKDVALASPVNSTFSVPWLHLTAVAGEGSLSDHVFRIETVGGQPPATCTGSGSISVKYAAKYFGFKAPSA